MEFDRGTSELLESFFRVAAPSDDEPPPEFIEDGNRKFDFFETSETARD